jgi:hypothetical protein
VLCPEHGKGQAGYPRASMRVPMVAWGLLRRKVYRFFYHSFMVDVIVIKVVGDGV